MGDEERCPFFEECFEGLGDKEFERERLRVAVVYFQKILAQARKANFVHVNVLATLSNVFNLRGFRVLGSYALDFVAGVKRKHSGQISGDRHSRDNVDIEDAFLVKNISDGGIVLGPAEAKLVRCGITGLSARFQQQISLRQAPGAAFRSQLFPCCCRVKIVSDTPSKTLRLKVFKTASG